MRMIKGKIPFGLNFSASFSFSKVCSLDNAFFLCLGKSALKTTKLLVANSLKLGFSIKFFLNRTQGEHQSEPEKKNNTFLCSSFALLID
jgi:hypothetical protein